MLKGGYLQSKEIGKGKISIMQDVFFTLISALRSLRFVPQLSRSSLQIRHFKHNMRRMKYAFSLGFFVTIENNRLVNLTPKLKAEAFFELCQTVKTIFSSKITRLRDPL